jgi:O-antigen/teichoic acid export membrane protein
MISSHKQLIIRYIGFSAAKVSLLIGKSAILVLAYSWLPIVEFTFVAGIISLIEIIRPISDMGAENIIYSRLAAKHRPLPKVVQKILHLRILSSMFVSVTGLAILAALDRMSFAPLIALPIIIALQNSNLAFLQKSNFQGKLAILSFSALVLSVASILIAYLFKAQGLALALLLISPELFTCLLGVLLTTNQWQTLFTQKTLYKRGGRQLTFYILPSISIGFIVMMYSRLDITFVRPMLGLDAQASYSAAFRLIDPILLLLSLASLTLLTELGVNNSANARAISIRLFEKIGLQFYIVYAGVFLGLAYVLHKISVEFLNFSNETAVLLATLALIIPVKLLNTFYSSLLQRAGKFHLILVAASITLTATFVLAFVFGMLWHVTGVALAAITAELINMIYQKTMVKKTLGITL